MSMGRKTGPKSEPVPCGRCGGSGTVPVDLGDRRKGETSCNKCGGKGTYPFTAVRVAVAVLFCSLWLTGCDPVTTVPAPTQTPAEDDPAWDCRLHGNRACVSVSP